MIYIIYGPTGSGKTDLAIEMILKNRKEKDLDGEIISADSRQIYIGMDIGTNKDKKKYEENKIKYHLIDILTPDKRFSVWEWNQLAKEKIEEITSREKDVYVVGGTGLYIDSLLYARKYTSTTTEIEKNEYLKLENLSINQIQKKFIDMYPKDYKKLNESEKLNKRRLINNYVKFTKSKGKEIKEKPNNYVLLKVSYELITPKYTRENLYERINKRVEKMFEEGFVEEVKRLIQHGYKECESMNGTGYRELYVILSSGKEIGMVINNVKEKIKQSNRNYAKRQITWFNKYLKDF